MNFTLKDLIKPEPDRTHFFLGALLNFHLYRGTKMNLIKPVIDECNAVDARRLELEARISVANAGLLEFNELREREASRDMDEKISRAEFDLLQSAQENAGLRSKIVQSPDKLQRALEDKKAALLDARNAERTAMQSFYEKTAILEVYTKVNSAKLAEKK